MLDFISTPTFRNDLKSLIKDYPTIKKDICHELSNQTFDEIFERNYRLKDLGLTRIIKLRVACSYQNAGKSSGFRVLLLANSKWRHVAFLTVYPKTGSSGKDNVSKAFISDCVKEYSTMSKENNLVFHDILNELASK